MKLFDMLNHLIFSISVNFLSFCANCKSKTELRSSKFIRNFVPRVCLLLCSFTNKTTKGAFQEGKDVFRLRITLITMPALSSVNGFGEWRLLPKTAILANSAHN